MNLAEGIRIVFDVHTSCHVMSRHVTPRQLKPFHFSNNGTGEAKATDRTYLLSSPPLGRPELRSLIA